jgi:hypothetical protein
MAMHTHADVDEAIAEMDRVVGAFFAMHRRNLRDLESNINFRVRDPDQRTFLQRRLAMAAERERCKA